MHNFNLHWRIILLCIILIIIIIILIMKVVGLGLWVLSCVAHSLSDDPVLSIFFLDGLYPFLHAVDTVGLVVVSSCFPFSFRAKANFVDSFWSHLLYCPDLVFLMLSNCLRKRICAASSCFWSSFYYPQLASVMEYGFRKWCCGFSFFRLWFVVLLLCIEERLKFTLPRTYF
jgi:hypothetical protein